MFKLSGTNSESVDFRTRWLQLDRPLHKEAAGSSGDNDTMGDRYSEWTRRALVPSALDLRNDVWQLVPEHPATAWVRNELARLGRTTSDEDVAFYLNKSLVQDVIYAAGAAEYTANKVYAAVEAYLTNALYAARPDADLEASDLARPTVDHLYIEWSSLLEKLRAVTDCIRGVDRGGVQLGLVPALKPDQDPRRRIENASDRLRLALDRAGLLTNYSIRLHALPNVTAKARIEKGRVILPIPDAPTERVYLLDQLTWDDGHDVVTFTHDAMTAVEAFIDEMLSAFETVVI